MFKQVLSDFIVLQVLVTKSGRNFFLWSDLHSIIWVLLTLSSWTTNNNKTTGVPSWKELIDIKVTIQILLYVYDFVYKNSQVSE